MKEQTKQKFHQAESSSIAVERIGRLMFESRANTALRTTGTRETRA